MDQGNTILASSEAHRFIFGQCGERLALNDGERWICVQTRPHKERVAATWLRDRGYRCFVPSVLKRIRHARRTQTMLKPFFPRYMFVAFDSEYQAWRPIVHTPGVSGVILEKGRPKPVPEGIVETLVDATDSSGSVDFRESLVVGQSIRLLTGPFADLVGKLERLDENGRVAVLLDVMGGERRVFAQKTALQVHTS